MATIPSLKKILRDRFPSDLKWMPSLLNPLNKFMEDVTLGLNKRLTITDNFDGKILSVEVDGTYPKNLAWDRSLQPKVGWIGKIQRSSGDAVSLSNAIFLVWSFNQEGQIQIDDVPGLDDATNKKYLLTLTFLVN